MALRNQEEKESIKLSILPVFLFVALFIGSSLCHHVVPSCDISAEHCDFDLSVEHNYTMMKWSGFEEDIPAIMYPVVVNHDETFEYKRKDCSGRDPIPESEKMNIITGDGTYKAVYLVNGKLPGTPIVVYEGQEVAVKVTNKLEAGVTTMHWHGLEQHNSPWMDGVHGVTQCPIQPGQSFTYRFIADKAGTHWYHSHLGTQRSMGIAGPLVVLPRSRTDELLKRGKDPIPKFDGDFYMMVQDWIQESSDELYHRLQYELISYRGMNDRECYLATKTADGVDLGIVPFESGLINGRGRRYNNETGLPEAMVPLESFSVKRGGKYRFRLISAAMAYPFRVSIDHHLLRVIATDGNDVMTTPVESIMIQSGERYDFWIDARDPTLSGNYWIRVETLEHFHHYKRAKPGHTFGILRYEEATDDEPTTERRLCTGVEPCTVLNCPFQDYLPEENTKCVPLTKLRDTRLKPTLSPRTPEMFTEHFLNFHFSGRLSKNIGAFKSNINGKVHIPHDRPPQIYPATYEGVACNETECLDDACMCSHQLDLPLGHVVQLVLFTNLPPLEFIGITGTAHPVHIHGHKFQVVKIGYPTYNQTTGLFEQNNQDIKCEGVLCNKATWADASWKGGNVPGIVSQGAPLKDTVIIPAGGYVVIRFLAHNPGFWYMHCHVEYHNEMGMALVLKEGDINDMNAAPENMQKCGSFEWTAKEFNQKVNSPSPPVMSAAAAEVVPCGDYLTHLKFTTFILAGTTIMFAVASFSLYCKNVAETKHSSVSMSGYERTHGHSERDDLTRLSQSQDEFNSSKTSQVQGRRNRDEATESLLDKKASRGEPTTKRT